MRDATRVAAAAPPVTGSDAGRAARGVLWLATNGVVVKGAQTAVLLVVAALLTPGSLGAVAAGALVANLAAVVAGLGTASALVHGRGDPEVAARTAVTLALLSGAALAGVLWVTAPALAALLGVPEEGPAVIRGMTVTLPCVAVAAVTADLLRRRLRFARRVLPDCVGALVGAVVSVLLLLDGAGVTALVAGQVVQAVLALLVSWLVHPPVVPGWRSDDARRLLRWGGPFASARLLEVLQLNVDYLVVAVVLGAASLGQYSLAFRVAYVPVLLVAVVVTGAAFPYLCRLPAERLGAAAASTAAVTLSAVLPLSVGVALLSDHLVLLGPAWAPAVPALAVLAGYAVGLSVVEVGQAVLNAQGRTAAAMSVRLGHLAAAAVVLPAVAHRGVTAVAAGQLAVVSAVVVVTAVVVRRSAPGFSPVGLARTLLPTLVAAAVMAAVMLICRALLDPALPSAESLLGVGGVGVIAYVGVMSVLDRRRGRRVWTLLRDGRAL